VLTRGAHTALRTPHSTSVSALRTPECVLWHATASSHLAPVHGASLAHITLSVHILTRSLFAASSSPCWPRSVPSSSSSSSTRRADQSQRQGSRRTSLMARECTAAHQRVCYFAPNTRTHTHTHQITHAQIRAQTRAQIVGQVCHLSTVLPSLCACVVCICASGPDLTHILIILASSPSLLFRCPQDTTDSTTRTRMR
jgi:hypothetical protein